MNSFQTDRALSELRRTMGRLETALHSVSDAIAWTDEQGRLAWCNQSFLDLIGKERIFVVGKPILEVFPLGPAEGKPSGQEFNFVDAEGNARLLRVATKPVPGAAGRMLTIQDQTRAQALMRELARSNGELETFAYEVAHELKAPLRKITGFIDLLSTKLAGTLDPDAKDLFRRVLKGSDRMESLVDTLLDYARIGGEGAGPRSLVPAQEALDAALENQEPAWSGAGGRLEAGDLPVVWGSRGRLEQLFANLISNSLKFRKKGAPPIIRLSAFRQGDLWAFRFADDGIGIPPDKRVSVFKPFGRVHSERDYPGLGMGLAICRKIVLQHLGRIWIESGPGRGTAICFTLRASPPKETPIDQNP